MGTQALQIAASHRDRFEVVLLAAHRSASQLAEAAATHRPAAACLTGPAAAPALPAGTRWFAGADGLLAALDHARPDVVLNAITGAAGLEASAWTLRHGLQLALANKESLVMAGEYLLPLAQRSGARILPVDSEHCAVFQCLDGEVPASVRRVLLTASGGPFRQRPLAEFPQVTVAEALRHPTWTMGPRITIGSATMMNKAFEILEARWLFDLPPDRIDVVIHPQSIVHSMVEFRDGSLLAQAGIPDMRVPILFCLGYPDRLEFDFQPFEFGRWRNLEFLPVEPARYPAVPLAYQVLAAGGDAGAVLNAVDEVATAAFLAGRIPFPSIVQLSERVLAEHRVGPIDSIAAVLAADAQARRAANTLLAAYPA